MRIRGKGLSGRRVAHVARVQSSLATLSEEAERHPDTAPALAPTLSSLGAAQIGSLGVELISYIACATYDSTSGVASVPIAP
jgi:hypothetical protein